MNNVLSLIQSFWNDDNADEGQAMVEYSLILVLMVVICIVVVTQLGDVIKNNLYGAIERLPL